MAQEDSPEALSSPDALSQGIATLKESLRTMPETPGVYQMRNAKMALLYVGKAKNLKKRVTQYTSDAKLPLRLKRLVAEVSSIEVTLTRTETEALLLECALIKKNKPKYNILMRDDKTFPYIILTSNHPFPRLLRHRGGKAFSGEYFGPFASVAAVDGTLITLHKIFQLRSCADSFFAGRKRPCLQYHIKRCSAPCVGKISPEDYEKATEQARAFLKGEGEKNKAVQTYLTNQMQKASEKHHYEEAALWRDRLKLALKVKEQQDLYGPKIKDADVLGIARLGNQTCVQVLFIREGSNYGTESLFLSHSEDASLEESLLAFLPQFYQDRRPPALVLLSHQSQADELSVVKEALESHHPGTRVGFQVPQKGKNAELVSYVMHNAEQALERKFAESTHMALLLQQLQELFHLPSPPERIEVYDNSHLFGQHPYGVMIVAGPQGFEKKFYRKFRLNSSPSPSVIGGGDDYHMMQEVFRRRFSLQTSPEENVENMPDLVLIDGGRGHLNAVAQLLKEASLSLPLVAIAKGKERNAGKETFHTLEGQEFQLPPHTPLLHFLQRLRDEAHRFAITTHRAKREKVLTQSRLDEIPGVGPRRKRLLLNHFGSVKSVKEASLEELKNTPGLDASLAHKIYNYFSEKNT